MDQLLFEQHPNAMFIFDPHTMDILRINGSFTELLGYTPQEVEHGPFKLHTLVSSDTDEQENLLELFSPSERKSDHGIVRIKSKHGAPVLVKFRSKPVEYKGRSTQLALMSEQHEYGASSQTRTSREELDHFVRNIPLATVKWDRNLAVREWSEQAAELTGYSREEMLGVRALSTNIVDRSERSKVNKHFTALAEGRKEQLQFETKIRDKTGNRIFINVYASVHRDSGGDIVHILTLVEDITTRKKSEIRYQRLFENANDSILILHENIFVDCNKQAEDLYKAEKKQIIGKSPVYFSPATQPNGRPSATEAPRRIKKAFEEGSHMFEWRHKNTDGDLIDVEVSLNKIDFPDGEYLQAIVRDISEKKKTQAKLRRNEELFRNLFLKSPAALVMIDVDDKIQLVNESFENMFGYKLKNIRGKNLDSLIVPKEEREKAPTMNGGSLSQVDFKIEGVRLTKNGTKRDVLIAGMPVYIDGEPVAGLGMYIDISERKHSEEQLKKSIKEKQVLLEEVHHRVKNNLAVVSGLLQMQTMHVEDERLTKYIQNSQLRIRSMAIVHEMLYQSATLSEIKFDTYVEKLVEVISQVLAPRAKNITIDIQADDILLNVNQAIPCALVISELITNAYEYAFEGRQAGTILLEVLQDKSTISISVQDNGVGLPADFEEKRQKSLGINLMENLCLQLETEIQVESGDWGTRFYFTFELANTPGSSSSNRI